MFFFDSFDAGLDGVARRVSVGARRLARRRSVVQCLCVRPCDGRVCHDCNTSCSVSCSTLPLRAFRGRLRSLILICGLFVFAFFPSVAHAQPSLEISGNPTGMTGNDKGYVVVNTNNQYDAALEVLGLWGTKIQLNQEMFAKLSNPETGGAFYTFASSFFRLGSDGVDYRMYPGWAGDTYYQTLLVDVYGFGNVWGVETNSEDMAAAKRDYNVIRNGGSLGGGGGVSADTYTLTLQESGVVRDSQLNNFYRVDGVRYLVNDYKSSTTELSANAPKTLTFDFSNASTKSLVEDRLALGWHLYVYAYPGSYSASGTGNSPLYFNVLLCNTTASVYPVEYSLGGVTWRSTNIKVEYDETKSYYIAKAKFATDYSAAMSWVDSDSFTIDGGLVHVSNASQFSDAGFASPRSNGRNVWINYDVSGPTLPPNNWPDDDPTTPTPTPDPPEVPGPNDDPIPQPDPPDLPNPVQDPVTDPYTPDPDPPTNPVVTYDPDPTGEPIDYRPWLNAILKLLRTINTTLDDGFYDLDVWLTEHCDHIRKQIHDEALNLGLKLQVAITNGFVSFERWLQTTFTPWFLDSLDVRLNTHLRELEGYLHDLFVWLANELDFTVSGGDFDDSTVVSWLKKIYLQLYQLGNRESSDTEQQLGTIDYDSSYGRVSAAYGELGDNLPFCVPDDMSTVLGWFVTAPVTPVFDVPWGFVGGSSSCHVDLSGWDGVAAACRSLFMALFCLELTKYTLHLWRLYRAAFAGVSV